MLAARFVRRRVDLDAPPSKKDVEITTPRLARNPRLWSTRRAAYLERACRRAREKMEISQGNFLRPIVGVEDVDSDLLGVAKAGTSTALGFVAFQSVQNFTFKAGTAWLDPADEPVAVKEEVTGPQASFS